jgi:hypothetical protein
MSGFLQRLLSRHAGELAIRPRASSRFESGAGPVGSSEQTEVLAAPPLATQARHAAPAPGPQPYGAAIDESPTETAGRRPPSRVAKHYDLERPPRDTEPARALQDAPLDSPAITDRGDAPVEPPSSARAHATADLPEAPDTRPSLSIAGGVGPLSTVPRVPFPAARMPQPVPRRAETAEPAPREPDVVHVHIGRVEVRAVMAAQERSRHTAPKPGAPRPLSLDRYLAGKRDR